MGFYWLSDGLSRLVAEEIMKHGEKVREEVIDMDDTHKKKVMTYLYEDNMFFLGQDITMEKVMKASSTGMMMVTNTECSDIFLFESNVKEVEYDMRTILERMESGDWE